MHKHNWISVILLVGLFLSVKLQFAVPMYPAPYMMPPPPPVGIPVPFPVPMPVVVTPKPTTSTTTRTKPSQQAVAIPVPYGVPMPVPYAVPQPAPPMCCVAQPRAMPIQPRPYPMPPPLPMMPVYPMPAPPPVVVVPFPHQYPRRFPPYRGISESSDSETDSSRRDFSSTDTDDSSSQSSSNELWRKRSHISQKKMKHRIAKRRKKILNSRKFINSNSDSDKLVRPMLTYIAKNGDVKYKKRISNDDADKLMGKDLISKGEQVADTRRSQSQKSQHLRINADSAQRTGKTKKFIFEPPKDRKISNLTVSFHLEK